MKFFKTIILLPIISLLFFQITSVSAAEIIIEDADTVWSPNLITASNDVIDSTDAPVQTLLDVFVSHADTVWSPDLITASSDVVDSTDAPMQSLSDVFVSFADTVWNPSLITASEDVIDSTDAPEQNFSDVFVSHADTVWSIKLGKWGVSENQPPNIIHTPITEVINNDPGVCIEAEITDSDAGDFVAWAKVYHRTAGHILYQSMNMTLQEENHYMPAYCFSAADGVDYYIVASDSQGEKSYHGTDVNPHHIASDTTPPTITFVGPIGPLPSGTTQFTFSFGTSEGAICKYNTVPDSIDYESMPYSCSDVIQRTHSIIFTGLSDGNTYAYTYYFKCKDETGNINTNDYVISISFNVLGESPPENQPPTCKIELQNNNGDKIDEINIGESFNIYVGDSNGDIGQVRFLSDESQDGEADENCNWTDPPFSWTEPGDTSWGWHWNHSNKKMEWSFNSPGDKEVWAEVSDNINPPIKCFADISTRESIKIEIEKKGLFGALLRFKNNNPKNEYIVSFEILDNNKKEILEIKKVEIDPLLEKISDMSFRLPPRIIGQINIVFDPQKKEDLNLLTNFYIKIIYVKNGETIEKLEKLHFGEYNNIIATNFDITENAYNFSNTDWQKGKCFGMAKTAELYFENELILPPEEINVYDIEKGKARKK